MLLRTTLPAVLFASSSGAFRTTKFVPAWISVASTTFGRVRAASTTPSCAVGTAAAEFCSTGVTRDLQPQPFWRFFEEISSIPRASKHEHAVLAYVKRFAVDRDLPWREDSAGNIVVEREGANGGEGAATVVIQGHVDMVTEKNADSSHDFLTDPISLVVDGDWLTADGTTLGADNGIGVAAALTLLDMPASSGAVLPPLECLFTVEEEIGLVGAFALDGSMLKGRTMLNLDTVEWGSLFVGCAGGGETLVTLPFHTSTFGPEQYTMYRITVDGLMGGHSGINIHEDRANAIKLLVRVLEPLMETVPEVALVNFSGGDKHNAIPREAFATVALSNMDNLGGEPPALKAAEAVIARVLAELKMEYGTKETSLSVRLEFDGESAGSRFGDDDARRLLSLLSLLPHGVLKMSHDLEGLVETSSNLASVSRTVPDSETPGFSYDILCSTRSSLSSSLEAVRRQIKTAGELSGASDVTIRPPYPGWQPDLGSNALKVARDSLRDLLEGQEPVIAALHAGLECGVIGDKAPGMDTVSFGPTIEGAHSPDERVGIASVGKFWQLVLRTLEGLAVGDKA